VFADNGRSLKASQRAGFEPRDIVDDGGLQTRDMVMTRTMYRAATA
jgi:RimJ/RimL family protein N-acetyltransferase